MPRKIDLVEAKQKAARFCAFQERSPKEVGDKLIKWGLAPNQTEEVTSQLIKEGFIDEQRFANAYCNDKFEFNSWGKQKIRSQISIHRLEAEVVENALNRINQEKYSTRVLELATRKWDALETEVDIKRKQKVLAYLGNKGFEIDLIWKVINSITTGDQ